MNGAENAHEAERLIAVALLQRDRESADDPAPLSALTMAQAQVRATLAVAAAVHDPKPGPCWHDSGTLDWSQAMGDVTIHCELDAGHAGAHMWKRPNGGEAVWPQELEVPALRRMCKPEAGR